MDYTFYRRRFHCPKCNLYEKPLDKVINCAGNYTLEVKESMVLLGQRIPFAEASYFLEKLLKVKVSHEAIQEFTEKIGKEIKSDEQKRVAKVIDLNGFVQDTQASASRKKTKGAVYMQLDGCMVQTREKGWKEVRNGILFSENNKSRRDKHHNLLLHKKYFSVFNSNKNSLENFKNRATQEADDFGFYRYEKQVIVGDGALYIWDYASTVHPKAIQILDYYHASEYLGNAFQSIKFRNEKKQKEKNKQIFEWLWEGKIRKIISWLMNQKQTCETKNCIRYFEKNIERMNYGLYRKQGLDIGSGAIESAHRIIVQTRMKQSGMYWGKNNVQSILSLRARYLSNEWNLVRKQYLKAA